MSESRSRSAVRRLTSSSYAISGAGRGQVTGQTQQAL
jgi:hypothetical protein